MTYLRRVDRNHATIVRELQQRGMSVVSLARMGAGVPDLLVGWRGIDRLVEVKAPKARPRGRSMRATDARQQDFAMTWNGAPVIRATTPEDVVDAFIAA